MADVATQQAINDLDHYPGGPSSGTGSDSTDPSQVGGQDPRDLFGIPIAYDSGAGGTPAPGGQSMMAADPTNEPNQYPDREPISGVELDDSGAPGSQGVSTGDPEPGGTPVTVTRPGLFLAGPVGGQPGTEGVVVTQQLSGPSDSTGTTQQSPVRHPVTNTPTPQDSGAGHGHVMRGGWMKGQRG
jgi:hypothetical protein